mmetsp:Transcript_8538/g.23194  ORF Transcript_8538/g.23194 Transcript_8538/m.23194 type:complete len:252 (-) Transcript_8538:456-1211(-)
MEKRSLLPNFAPHVHPLDSTGAQAAWPPATVRASVRGVDRAGGVVKAAVARPVQLLDAQPRGGGHRDGRPAGHAEVRGPEDEGRPPHLPIPREYAHKERLPQAVAEARKLGVEVGNPCGLVLALVLPVVEIQRGVRDEGPGQVHGTEHGEHQPEGLRVAGAAAQRRAAARGRGRRPAARHALQAAGLAEDVHVHGRREQEGQPPAVLLAGKPQVALRGSSTNGEALSDNGEEDHRLHGALREEVPREITRI